MADNPILGDVPVQPAQPVQQPQQNPEPAQIANEPSLSNLPDDSSQRTQDQFSKVLDNNKKLMDANQQLQSELQRRNRTNLQYPEVSKAPENDPVEPNQLPQISQPKTPDPADFIEVDPTTGERYINENKMKTAFTEAITKSQQVESRVDQYIKQQEDLDQARQRSEAFTAYPELNPDQTDSFNNDLHIETRQVLLDSMVNPNDYGGRILRFKEAADVAKARAKARTDVSPKPEIDATEKAKQQGKKEQAALEATGISGGEMPSEQIEAQAREATRLRTQVRAGDDLALAKRLSQVPHVIGQEGVERKGGA